MNTVLYIQLAGRTSPERRLAGILDVAKRCNWHVQTVSAPPSLKQLTELIEFWDPLGAIVECGGEFAHYDTSPLRKIPTVYLCHDPSVLPKGAFCIFGDSVQVARAAARELIAGGMKHFAYVPNPGNSSWSRERQEGFARALQLNGFGCSVFDISGLGGSSTRLQKRLRTFLRDLPKPVGIFAANDTIAAEVLTAAAFEGIPVPRQLTVVGVDNYAPICEHTQPTLSSVDPDFRRGGSLAATMLMAVLRKGKAYVGAHTRTFEPIGVIRRASTRHLENEDADVSAALDRITRNACNGLTAAEVLKGFGCSRRLAEIRFRRATGHSVLEEIHAVQLNRAKSLLGNLDISMKAIGDFCGFRNTNSFRKFFLRETGKTLSAWRREASSASRPRSRA